MLSNVRVLVVGSLFTLAACGGGGGGGGVATGVSNPPPSQTIQFSGFSSMPNDGTVEISGTMVERNYSQDLGTGDVNFVGSASGPYAGSLTLTSSGGDLSEIDLATFFAPSLFGEGSTLSDSGSLLTVVAANGTDLGFIADPIDLGFEHQSFGMWLTGIGTGNGQFGVGSFGSETPNGALPTTTTASYNGASIGVVRFSDGQPYASASNISISTDFTTATISSSSTSISNLNTASILAAPGLDFTGTGPVSGSSFTSLVSGTSITGTANGTFYGPNAEEVGGTFSASGTGIDYIGSFGGIR